MLQTKVPFKGQGFDFIFAGAGCASLSLLMRMIDSGKFSEKKILLIDKAPKIYNDRTWCFWEKENGFFEEIVFKRWDNMEFLSETYSAPLNIKPYQYKMIRGIDFYNYCFGKIAKCPNIEILYGDITSILQKDNKVIIDINDEQFDTKDAIVFNSIYNPSVKQSDATYLLQHFKGWIIETELPAFNPSKGTFMDFRVHQQHGTAFAYVLPLSETKALVEYTLFTGKLLDKQKYDEELRSYISNLLKIDKYKIPDEEFGVIPMTNEKFNFYKNGIYNIGTAGGQTKASSGYTFRFIQKQSRLIVDCLINGKSLQAIPSTPGRFNFYDTVLLRLLDKGKLSGAAIFSKLFQRNKASAVFKFLDNETSIPEELKIISTLPALPFLKAAIQK
ncbi:MAG: lycopene cyclase family protein [Bacteroidota bacterium]